VSEAKDIDKKIEQIQNQINKPLKQKITSIKTPSSMIFDLFAGALAGGILGYALDRLCNTKFAFISIFSFCGFCGSFYNLYKSISKK